MALDGKKFLLEKFIGVHSSKVNTNAMKRATMLLEANYRQFYKTRANKAKIETEDPFVTSEQLQKEVLVPSHYYQDRIKENLHVKVRKGSFRSRLLVKFAQNIIVIEKMLLEDNKSIDYAAKWLGVSIKNFKICVHKYYKSLTSNYLKAKDEYDSKIIRAKKLKELISLCFSQNKGKCVDTKKILDFINPIVALHDPSLPEFKYSEIISCLKNTFDMSWRKANVRPPSSLRPNLEGDREIFNTFISYLEK